MKEQKQYYEIWEAFSMAGSEALKNGDLLQAEEAYAKALTIANEIAKETLTPLELLLLAISYSQAGDVKRAAKDYPAAIVYYDQGIDKAQKAIDTVPATIAKLAGIQEYEKNLGILYLKSSFCFEADTEERKNRLFWATKIFEKICNKADCKDELSLCYRMEEEIEGN